MTNILFKIARTCNSRFKCNYLKNQKPFGNLLLHFWNLHLILNILKEKMIVIANVFPKLQTVKIFLRPPSKKRCFRTRSDSQHPSQILVKYLWEHFYHIFSSFWGKLISKMFPLVLGEVLGVCVNILTDDDKNPVEDCEDLELPIQIQLLEKRKIFCEFFVTFLECASNFKHFERKDVGHS